MRRIRPAPGRNRPSAAAIVLLSAALICSNATSLLGVFADERMGGQSPELTITASFTDKQVTADEPIELRLSQPLTRSQGTLAVIIGQSDLTGLFTVAERSLRYNPRLVALPFGNSELTVYLVSPKNEWKELARFSLRVGKERIEAAPQDKSDKKDVQTPPAEVEPEQQIATSSSGQTEQLASSSRGNSASTPENKAQEAAPGSRQSAASRNKRGFEKLDFVPSLTLTIKSQAAEAAFPLSARSQRPTFTDLNLQATSRGEMARGLFNMQTQFDVAGSSFQKEALRFGQLGDRAPNVDLASYLTQLQLGKAKYVLGHSSYGSNRQLINGFSSRGMTLTIPFASRFDLALAAMNGTAPVGYDNFFGLANRRHQLLSGTFGVEVFPKRPSGLRFEAAMLDGWVQPVSSFNQGSVNDADRSQGWAVRVLAVDPGQRFRLDGGFTRSRFESPNDPLLSQGNAVVSLAPPPRNARYFDASYNFLKDLAVRNQRKANFTFTWRHEMVEPLFRSLGASTQADKAQNQFELGGNIGEVNVQFAYLRFNDNLFDVPSILKSLTRAENLNVGAPLSTLLGKASRPPSWLPRISYSLNRTHQYAAFIPTGGGFEQDPSAIPNLVGTNQSATAEWQFQKWRVGYRFNHSLQDNQQTLRELADLSNLANGFLIGVTVTKSLDLNLDLSRESAHNRETGKTDHTLRLAPAINWRMTNTSALAANLSTSLAGNSFGDSDGRNIEFDLQWSYRFAFGKDRFKKVQSQFFIRYANRYALARDRIFIVNNLNKLQTLNLGLSFTFF
jgi:hypothetical protein